MEEVQRRSYILVGENEKLFERVEEQNKRIIELNKSQHEFELTMLNLKSTLEIKTKRLDAVEKERKTDRDKIQ